MILTNDPIHKIILPEISFITVFSGCFLNRQKQTSYVANTALFINKDLKHKFVIDNLLKNISFLSPKDALKNNDVFKICFVVPDYNCEF